jgi:hypothetical protein
MNQPQRPFITPNPLPIFGKDDIELHTGDFFGSENPSAWIGKPISYIQKFHSRDNESVYTHSGCIINPQGHTVESLWTVKSQYLWKAYKGKRVIIGRWEWLTAEDWEKAYNEVIFKHWGDKYPWWRLPLHIIPPAAKYLSFTGMPVCSELVAKIEHSMGARGRWWTGTNPDTLADEWKRWKGFNIIAEGVIG